MAKKSKIARNEQRKEVIARYAVRRLELKKIISSPSTGPQERQDALRELQRQPRDASPTRFRNRCVDTGRPRGNLRAYGPLSRVRFRELAHRGELPGVQKGS